MQHKTSLVEKYSHLPQESVMIMQYLDRNNRINMLKACELITTVSKPTIKNRLAELVKLGLIVRHGKARATWYSKAMPVE